MNCLTNLHTFKQNISVQNSRWLSVLLLGIVVFGCAKTNSGLATAGAAIPKIDNRHSLVPPSAQYAFRFNETDDIWQLTDYLAPFVSKLDAPTAVLNSLVASLPRSRDVDLAPLGESIFFGTGEFLTAILPRRRDASELGFYPGHHAGAFDHRGFRIGARIYRNPSPIHSYTMYMLVWGDNLVVHWKLTEVAGAPRFTWLDEMIEASERDSPGTSLTWLSAPRPAHQATSLDVHSLTRLSSGRDRPEFVASKLRAQRASVPRRQQAIIDRLILALEPMRSSVAGDKKRWSDIKRILRELRSQEPNDFVVQLSTTAFFQTDLTGYANIGMDSAVRVEEEIKRSRELVERFPKEARSFENLGDMQSLPSGNELEALRAFKRCFELDAAATDCRDKYNGAADNYALAACSQQDVHPQLGVYRATQRELKAPRRSVIWMGEPHHVASKPVIDSSDVYKVTAKKRRFNVEFTAHGIEKLETHIRDLTFPDNLILLAGDKVLTLVSDRSDAPRAVDFDIDAFVDSGILVEEGVSMDDICAVSQSRRLPKELPASL